MFVEIEFKEGETQHTVEIEVIFDGVREMREAFTVHLKPDENMVAETQVSEMVPYIHRPERWFSRKKRWLLLDRTWVQFPAPTWWLTAICSSSSRRSNALFWPLWALHTHSKNTVY